MAVFLPGGFRQVCCSIYIHSHDIGITQPFNSLFWDRR
jgi:hypothetical protein